MSHVEFLDSQISGPKNVMGYPEIPLKPAFQERSQSVVKTGVSNQGSAGSSSKTSRSSGRRTPVDKLSHS